MDASCAFPAGWLGVLDKEGRVAREMPVPLPEVRRRPRWLPCCLPLPVPACRCARDRACCPVGPSLRRSPS